jgi:hypothetical protein
MKMAKLNVMTITSLEKLLDQLLKELPEDFQVWLSSDDEGNSYSPLLQSTEFSLYIDSEKKRIIFFPSAMYS